MTTASTTQDHAGTSQADQASQSAAAPALTRDVRANKTSKTGRYVETREYLQAARRFLDAASRRVGDGMDVENLAALDELARYADTILYDAARTLKAGTETAPGYSWNEIGQALGVTQQTACRRFGPKRQDPRTVTAARIARTTARKEG